MTLKLQLSHRLESNIPRSTWQQSHSHVTFGHSREQIITGVESTNCPHRACLGMLDTSLVAWIAMNICNSFGKRLSGRFKLHEAVEQGELLVPLAWDPCAAVWDLTRVPYSTWCFVMLLIHCGFR